MIKYYGRLYIKGLFFIFSFNEDNAYLHDDLKKIDKKHVTVITDFGNKTKVDPDWTFSMDKDMIFNTLLETEKFLIHRVFS